MKLTAVTATWQRPEAMALCRKYVERQSRQPDQWLILDGPERMGDKLLTAFASGAVEGDALVFVEFFDRGDGTFIFFGLGDFVMVIGIGGDLGKMSDHQNLPLAA